MQSQCVKIPLLAGKTARFLAWVAENKGRRGEMIESMKREGVLAEAMFLERGSSGDFVVHYMKAESLAHVGEVFEKSKEPIDIGARAMIKECWDVDNTVYLNVEVDLIGAVG